MAYIPPHKKHLKSGGDAPLPALPPGFRNNNNNNNNNKNKKKKNQIVMAKDCIVKWFVVGLDQSINLSTFTTLNSVPTDSLVRKFVGLFLKENSEEAKRKFPENPWVFIAETVKEDFVVSMQKVNDLMNKNAVGVLKPYLIARFGKVLFVEDEKRPFGSGYTEGTLARSRQSFYTNVPPHCLHNITNDVVPQIGLDFLEEKELYYLILSDNTQSEPNSTILCKCDVIKDVSSLHLRKLDVNPVRHFVADMTCIDKNLDLRLALLTKRNSISVNEKELENIKSLISLATLDKNHKGGLTWPLGKRSLDRYNVVNVWHTNSKTFKNSSIKLKLRVADRYNFETSEGEDAREVSLKLNDIVSLLGEETLDTEVIFEMLKQNLELIWKHFIL